MKKFKLPVLVMLGTLALFFIIGGVPKPRDVQWQQYSWTYSGRSDGVTSYVSEAGGEFTVKRLSGRDFLLGIEEKEHKVSLRGSLMEITFSDGREAKISVAYFDDYLFFPHVEGNLTAGDGNIVRLAAEIDRVYMPDKGTFIAVAIVIMALGVVHYGYPLTCVKFELSFRAWAIKDPEPTEEYVTFTKVLGGLLMLGGWIFLLCLVWK